MWSTGAVLYCILSGAPPFSGSESVGETASSKRKRAVKLVVKVVVSVVVQLYSVGGAAFFGQRERRGDSW